MPDQRIIYTYEMHRDNKRISVSLATIERKRSGSDTRLIFAGQGVLPDGYDNSADREHGTRGLLDHLDAALGREGAIT